MENQATEKFSELVEEYEEEFETPAELHRMAAHHLMQASKQQWVTTQLVAQFLQQMTQHQQTQV